MTVTIPVWVLWAMGLAFAFLFSAIMVLEGVNQWTKAFKVGRLFYRFLCWRLEFEKFLEKEVDQRKSV